MNNSHEIRRANGRGRIRTDWLDAYCSFSFGSYQQAGRERFGALRVLNEDFIAPASGFGPHPHEDMEILLMPLRSAVRHADSLGNRLDVRPDELLLMHAGRGIEHSQMNASSTLQDHHLQLWFLPRRRGGAPGIALGAFPSAGRAGRWQLWASGQDEPGALTIDADARVLRACLAPGQQLGSPLPAGRRLYLHLISGALTLALEGAPPHADALRLQAGDALAWPQGAGFLARALDAEPAELLLIDLQP